jgi:hypothetical protein
MTDQAHLERAYRRLLAWYPRAFREEHGQEILGVLLAGAPDGQRRPSLAESADLIRGGLWMRLRPSAPRSAPTVRAAVRFMYAGAVVSALNLIILLALIGDIKAYHAILANRLTTAQVSQTTASAITMSIAFDLVPIALWLWMAQANGQGRNWARSLSTVLIGLATLSLSSVFPQSAINIDLVPTVHLSFIPALAPIAVGLTWLPGAAAVWLLWRPASSAFFRPPGYAQARHTNTVMRELDGRRGGVFAIPDASPELRRRRR